MRLFNRGKKQAAEQPLEPAEIWHTDVALVYLYYTRLMNDSAVIRLRFNDDLDASVKAISNPPAAIQALADSLPDLTLDTGEAFIDNIKNCYNTDYTSVTNQARAIAKTLRPWRELEHEEKSILTVYALIEMLLRQRLEDAAETLFATGKINWTKAFEQYENILAAIDEIESKK